MEGSAYMGLAEALFEEQVFKDAAPHHGPGLHHGPSLLDYRIPTSLDAPEFVSLIIESIDPEGPYGAKEAGEGPLHPSIPALANAIYDALGIRCDALPVQPAARAQTTAPIRVGSALRADRALGEARAPRSVTGTRC